MDCQHRELANEKRARKLEYYKKYNNQRPPLTAEQKEKRAGYERERRRTGKYQHWLKSYLSKENVKEKRKSNWARFYSEMSDEYKEKRNEKRRDLKYRVALYKWRKDNPEKMRVINLKANTQRRTEMKNYAKRKREEKPTYKLKSIITSFEQGSIGRAELLCSMRRAYARSNGKGDQG